MSTVFIKDANYENVQKIIEDIFSELGINLSGKTVLIKPNLLGAYPPERAVTTHPSVVKAVVDIVKSETKSVIVGDNPMRALIEGDLKKALEVTGVIEAAGPFWRNIGANAKSLDIGSEVIDEILISDVIKKVDYFINLPKFKTHILTGITCCVKNLFGLIPGAFKAKLHYKLRHPKILSRLFVDIYKYVTPNINIVDGILGMDGDGPTNGRPRLLGKIIAGENGVEVDSICAHMMGFKNPKVIPTISIASELGLGSASVSDIEVSGNLLVFEDFLLPKPYAAPKEYRIKGSIEDLFNLWDKLGQTPKLLKERCVLCGECEKICPASAITMDPYPVIDEKRCIACYCCCENCQEGALEVPSTEHFYRKMEEMIL